jgi:hypothetical protein
VVLTESKTTSVFIRLWEEFRDKKYVSRPEFPFAPALYALSIGVAWLVNFTREPRMNPG